MPPVLPANTSAADKDAAKYADDLAVEAYDQQVSFYSDALSINRDELTTYMVQ